MLAIVTTGLLLSAPRAAAAAIRITYLALAVPHPHPSTDLEPPPTDPGLAGARVAIADNATTGRFLGQTFEMQEQIEPDAGSLLQAARDAIAAGSGLLVTDLPPKLLLQLADLPEAHGVTILDATDPDDALRGADCRANVLHTAPSRAMLADGLMQYLLTQNWRHIMLLIGRAPEDALYAAAVRRAAEKFRITINVDRAWNFNPAAQQADTGHFQVNTEVANATQGASYDVLVVADEAGNFGDSLSYRTQLPRPVAGTQGMVASAWATPMDEYASPQLQSRFMRMAHRPMGERDYTAWLAVRAIGEAATRAGSADAKAISAFMRSPAFQLAGYKGLSFSFRTWDGQLRQPVLLADARSLISISPQPGFLHQFNVLDTLGVDAPETQCHFPP
jgi:ABC transporter substrate binding protein (PQQ-dependent alcohol dehydrogenase system)